MMVRFRAPPSAKSHTQSFGTGECAVFTRWRQRGGRRPSLRRFGGMGALENTEERLYGLPLDAFIAERNEAAKALRAEGDREAAAAIRKLRKPSAAAWAVNAAVRADPEAAKRVVRTGRRLEAAQAKAVAGGGGSLREAAAAHGEAIDAMVEALEATLGDDAKAAVVDRARETMRAVAADAEVRDRFERGTLVREVAAVGFGAFEATPAPPPERDRKAKPASASAAQRRRAAQAYKRADRALQAAVGHVEDVEGRVERARAALADAEGALAEARGERDARRAELDRARAAVRELESS
jgi:hypothetical protein